MSRKRERRKKEREKNAIYSGHLRLCQQPRAAHALRSDQLCSTLITNLFDQAKAIKMAEYPPPQEERGGGEELSY